MNIAMEIRGRLAHAQQRHAALKEEQKQLLQALMREEAVSRQQSRSTEV